MNIFIIGPSRSAKTPIANLVAKELGVDRISASDWIRSIFNTSNPIVTIEDKQKALEEITLLSQNLLKENPNRCIDYLQSKYAINDLDHVLEGFRNPRDFLTLFNPRNDRVVLLTHPSSPLHPLTFETEGLSIIEQSIDWFVQCEMMLESSVMKIIINDFQEVESIADSVVKWIKQFYNVNKFAVLAEPPAKGIFAGMSPRLQIKSGTIATYSDYEEAERQTLICNQSGNNWKYSVVKV